MRKAGRFAADGLGHLDGPGILGHAKGMVRMLITLQRTVLFTVLTVALVATGFAHRMQVQEDEALAFAFQNGVSLSDICGDLGKGMHPGTDCLACQIAGAADLPPRTGSPIDLGLAFDAEVGAPREELALPRRADPAHLPQGPPVA
jgi:hypothetical protein